MDTLEFCKVLVIEASSTVRTATATVADAGAEGDDDGAERFDACEVTQPAGLMAIPSTTATTEAVGVRRGDELVLLCVIDKGATPQVAEAGETRVYGVGSGNATAVMRIRADGDIEITPKAGKAVRIGGGTLSAALDGVVVAQGIDTFTGATYGALGNASSVVLAKKT